MEQRTNNFFKDINYIETDVFSLCFVYIILLVWLHIYIYMKTIGCNIKYDNDLSRKTNLLKNGLNLVLSKHEEMEGQLIELHSHLSIYYRLWNHGTIEVYVYTDHFFSKRFG